MVFYVTERNQGKDEVTRCAEVRTDIQVLRSSKLLEGSWGFLCLILILKNGAYSGLLWDRRQQVALNAWSVAQMKASDPDF